MTTKEKILKELNEGKTMTGIDGLRLCQTMKLSTRIGELRRNGHPIKDRWVEQNGKKFKEYYIEEQDRKVS